jgi:hypothetical protein
MRGPKILIVVRHSYMLVIRCVAVTPVNIHSINCSVMGACEGSGRGRHGFIGSRFPGLPESALIEKLHVRISKKLSKKTTRSSELTDLSISVGRV